MDDETREPVDSADKGRGYEIDKNVFIPVEDDELEALQVEATHTIEIDKFVPASQIDERFHDTPYYVVPNDKGWAGCIRDDPITPLPAHDARQHARERRASASCWVCHHAAVLDVDGYADDVPVPWSDNAVRTRPPTWFGPRIGCTR